MSKTTKSIINGIFTNILICVVSVIMTLIYGMYTNDLGLNAKLCAYSKYASVDHVISNGVLHCRSATGSFQKLELPKAIDYTIKKESVMVAIIKTTEQ